MKFRVYTTNPVNVNIGYIPAGDGDLSFLEEIELNYKHISPVSITVDSPKVFYYAIDENDNAWRTVGIDYVTNTKIVITLFSQTLNCFKTLPVSYTAVGSINATREQFTNDFTFNKVVSYPSTWISDKPNQLIGKYDLTAEWEDVCIFQLSQPLAGENRDITTSFTCYDGLAFLQKGESAFINYGNLEQGINGTLNVYTYVTTIKYEGTSWSIISKFFNELVQERTDFINARFIKLPKNSFTGNFSYMTSKLKYKTDDTDTLRLAIGVIQSITPDVKIIDEVDKGELLYGTNCWKIGEHLLYPNIDSDGKTCLKMVVILGVGTCFGFFFTGNYEDLIETNSYVTMELGYNFAPNTINPSLYYTNKQYQGLINASPILNAGASILSTVASIALMPKASLGAKALLGVAGSVGAVNALSNGQKKVEENKFNRATVNNTNDVQDIANYFSKNIQVCRLQAIQQFSAVAKDILDGYSILHNNYANEEFINYPNLIKAKSIDNEINVALINEGLITADNRSLKATLKDSNI